MQIETSVLLAPPAPDNPNVREAAQQFEALLIAQMLRSTRESTGGDASTDSITEFAEQQFASVLSANAGLGFAALINNGLLNAVSHKNSAESDPAVPLR